MRTVLISIGVLLQLIVLQSVFAYDDSWPNEEELWGLPEYCRPLPFMGGRSGDYDLGSPLWQKWYPMLGEGYKHTHHYCSGLNFITRSYKVRGNPGDLRGLLGRAVDEFDYVIRHSPKDFLLLPEVLTQRARTYVRLSKPKQAKADFEASIRLNPQYMPPYAGLIDLLIATGNKAAAREVYEAGMKEKPDSVALKRFEGAFKAN